MKKPHSEAWYINKINYYIVVMSACLTVTGQRRAYNITTYYINKLIEQTSEQHVLDILGNGK